MSRFNFVIEHIRRAKNIFADLLTRWTKGYRTVKAECSNIAALFKGIVPGTEELKAPLESEVREAQRLEDPPVKPVEDTDGLWKIDGRTWIPKNVDHLKLKILIEGHCGGARHRRKEATRNILREGFEWDCQKGDVNEFVQNCWYCITSWAGDRIPCPLAVSLLGQKPDEVVHMDFLYMGLAEGSELQYVLVIKDDLSSYSWSLPYPTADSEAAVVGLSKWIAAFVKMVSIVTDGGSHFTASLMEVLTQDAGINHHLTTAYCPWANGTVERLCKEVLRATRALVSEWRLAPGKWTSVIECIQTVLNQSPVERLGRHSSKDDIWLLPLEVFTGMKPIRFKVRPTPLLDAESIAHLEDEYAKGLPDVNRLHVALAEIHEEVSANNSWNMHKLQTKVFSWSFHVGEYVMIRSTTRRKHKLCSVWTRPHRIVNTKSESVFMVEDLKQQRREVIHCQPMIPYHAQDAKQVVPDELNLQSEYLSSGTQLVDRIVDVRAREGDYDMLVKWDGWKDSDGMTWDPS